MLVGMVWYVLGVAVVVRRGERASKSRVNMSVFSPGSFPLSSFLVTCSVALSFYIITS